MSDVDVEWLRIEEDDARWGATGNQHLANEIEERLIALAVRVINMTTALPKIEAGRHIANQILRSGTSPALITGKLGERRAERISHINLESFAKN